jgi:hypothetical protein
MKLTFWDPVPVLQALRQLEVSDLWQDLPERVRRLRTASLKDQREARNAAIFAHGLATVLCTKVLVSPTEDQDFDFVVTWTEGSEDRFSAIQLKELVPDDLNNDQRLDDLLAGLRKYAPTDTILAILLNKSLPVREIRLDAIPFRELWLFWQARTRLINP